MDAEQMRRRCPGATVQSKAVLAWWRFIINSRGVASIVPDAAAEVHGLLWSLTPGDVSNLDCYEGVSGGYYTKQALQVVSEDGRKVTALVYVAAQNDAGRPRPGYLGRIVTAARHLKLPPEYIEELRS